MDKNVTIYTTPTCHFCHLSKDFFKAHGVEFTEYDVLSDLDKRREMVERSGQMGVPVIFVGDEMVIGFDQQRLASLLNLA
ncbi:MAG TPA: glutaredoxin domain-containing protein [Candidatus Paceibacterota bacterium]